MLAHIKALQEAIPETVQSKWYLMNEKRKFSTDLQEVYIVSFQCVICESL